jgi:hypothetical protein
VNGVHLETPSEMQKSHVQKKEAAHMAPGVVEARSASLRELTEAEIQDKMGATGPRIQRKKAKGPNPLASKPKKPKHAQQQKQPAAGGGGAVSGEGEEGGAKKRKRRRRTSGDGSGE